MQSEPLRIDDDTLSPHQSKPLAGKRGLKQRIVDEVVKFLIAAFYLWVMFGTFALHESVVSDKDHINFKLPFLWARSRECPHIRESDACRRRFTFCRLVQRQAADLSNSVQSDRILSVVFGPLLCGRSVCRHGQREDNWREPPHDRRWQSE